MQVAILDGEPVIAFDMTPDEFEAVRARYKADPACLVLPDGAPAIPKRTKAVAAHFAHKSGYPATGEPETIHHITAKRIIRDVAVAAGWQAQIEARHPDGKWQADVLLTKQDRRVAFEVQWSPQTVEEYRFRTARYAEDGVEAIWLAKWASRSWWDISRAVPAIPYRAEGKVGAHDSSISDLQEVIPFALLVSEEGEIPESAPRLREANCYRCGYRFVYKANGALFGDKEPFTQEQLDWLGGHGAILKVTYSRTAGGRYPGWHCPRCRRLQGDFPLRASSTAVTIHQKRIVEDLRGAPFWHRVEEKMRPNDEPY